MFKPSKMSRIRLIVHKKYSDEVLSALQDIGVMQIESIPENVLKALSLGGEMDNKRLSDYAQRFRGLESLLYQLGSEKMYSFESMEQLTAEADGVIIDERVAQIKKDLDSIEANLRELDSRMLLLDKLDGFDGDISALNSRSIVSYAVSGQQLKQFEEEMEKKHDQIIKCVLKNATVFSMRREFEKEFATLAEKHRVVVEFVQQMRGTTTENAAKAKSEKEFMLKRKSGLTDELTKISENYYPLISALREQFDIEMEKVEVISKLGRSASITVIEGWMPDESVKTLEKLIKGITDDKFILEYVKSVDHAPTLMRNPVTTKLYEFFVRFYSIPKSNEIDPTIMFALAFPVFFGFMVGDFGYGLLMLLLSLFIINRINHPPKVSRLPKMITSFITLLVSRKSLKILAKSIIPGAIIAMILGIVFNEYFGFQLPYQTPFNVETGLGTLLVLSGWIGVFMVEFGFFLGFLNKMAEGEKKHAAAKIGWMLAGAGFVIFGLNILHQAQMGIGNPIAVASYVLLISGVAVIVACEGGRGIMELPSLISHMLSYTRLVGILLASVILASVIDLIFVGGWHHSILLGIVGTVILIVGQLFNIIIALFEPGIQGARLIYVEFFSKFFEGNGNLFKPFTTQRNRTLAKFKLD